MDGLQLPLTTALKNPTTLCFSWVGLRLRSGLFPIAIALNKIFLAHWILLSIIFAMTKYPLGPTFPFSYLPICLPFYNKTPSRTCLDSLSLSSAPLWLLPSPFHQNFSVNPISGLSLLSPGSLLSPQWLVTQLITPSSWKCLQLPPCLILPLPSSCSFSGSYWPPDL